MAIPKVTEVFYLVGELAHQQQIHGFFDVQTIRTILQCSRTTAYKKMDQLVKGRIVYRVRNGKYIIDNTNTHMLVLAELLMNNHLVINGVKDNE